MFKVTLLFFICLQGAFAGAHESDVSDQSIDLSLINATSYDLSKPIFAVKPSLGRGLRDMQSSSGGSACTSCAH